MLTTSSQISTYSGRGTTKPGCIPYEHSAVYTPATHPTLLKGEADLQDPICIQPADPSILFVPASRLHYGKVYPIEMNVKAKDLGNVMPEQIAYLLDKYKEINYGGHASVGFQ